MVDWKDCMLLVGVIWSSRMERAFIIYTKCQTSSCKTHSAADPNHESLIPSILMMMSCYWFSPSNNHIFCLTEPILADLSKYHGGTRCGYPAQALQWIREPRYFYRSAGLLSKVPSYLSMSSYCIILATECQIQQSRKTWYTWIVWSLCKLLKCSAAEKPRYLSLVVINTAHLELLQL